MTDPNTDLVRSLRDGSDGMGYCCPLALEAATVLSSLQAEGLEKDAVIERLKRALKFYGEIAKLCIEGWDWHPDPDSEAMIPPTDSARSEGSKTDE